jgi:5-methylcytosine-specific restriction endonuclease McrBC regulatory subunit McrC
MKAMKTMMRITDNQHKIVKEEFVEEYPKLSNLLLDRTLESLSQDERVFIFPNDLKNSPDLEKDQKIFETVNQEIKTGNVIGFLGCGQERLTISSRFSDESNDHFLHYLLHKVLHINLTSLDVALSREERLYQLLMYLFPKYLQAAIRKGLYKEYHRFSHNDSNVKGVIDVRNHLKKGSRKTFLSQEILPTQRESSPMIIPSCSWSVILLNTLRTRKVLVKGY